MSETTESCLRQHMQEGLQGALRSWLGQAHRTNDAAISQRATNTMGSRRLLPGSYENMTSCEAQCTMQARPHLKPPFRVRLCAFLVVVDLDNACVEPDVQNIPSQVYGQARHRLHTVLVIMPLILL